MNSIRLNWKSFKIHLPSLESHMRNCLGNLYVGNSASEDGLTLWLGNEPLHNDIIQIKSYWEMLSEESEALKIQQESRLNASESVARENLPYTDFTEMTPAEKKIFMGMPLTQGDREALLKKYPVD